jgi:exopolysaccharide biosynthesis WecB/TagA/CpsF family protein
VNNNSPHRKNPPEARPPTLPVLGTDLACTDYDSLGIFLLHHSRTTRSFVVDFTNTHIVTLRRHDPQFRLTTSDVDLFIPDGMPLIWCLNMQGAALGDRVYGPTFFRKFLATCPPDRTHYFLGGNDECLSLLRRNLLRRNPALNIAAMRNGYFHDDEPIVEDIERHNPDFLWVGLGTPRQQEFIHRWKTRLSAKVVLAVGFAFDVNAGTKPDAPLWMQRLGLTWLYRLASEPHRLWRRYTRFNTLFLYYTARDALLGTPTPTPSRLPSIAFLGSRGVPARYSGFEVVVEELGSRLAALGHPVTVYNRLPRFEHSSKTWKGMRIVGLYTIPTKTLDTIVHTFLSMLHAIRRRYDIIYLCGVGNSILARLAKAAGMRVVINVDGADFRRKKWGGFARWWLKKSERWAMQFGDSIIADNTTVADRYLQDYGKRPEHLSYGLTIRETPVRCGELEKWGLQPRQYFLYVSRLTPENEAELLLRAYRLLENPLPLVLVGADPYEHVYRRKLAALATDHVIFTGLRFADAYIELSQNTRAFIMPATIEATRLVLLDQLGMGTPVIYHDCPATREVLGDTGIPFAPDHPVENLAAKITWATHNPDAVAAEGQRIRARAELFRWENVLARYEQIFTDILPTHPTKNTTPTLLPPTPTHP